MSHRIFLAACLVAAGGVARAQTASPLIPAVAAPKSWGTVAGATTLMAHDFAENLTGYFVTKYLGATSCQVTPGVLETVEAFGQLSLPHGARLSQLQFWAYDTDPVDGLNLTLWETCQVVGTPVSNQLASVDTVGAIGTYFGFTPLNDHRVDAASCSYTVRVQFNPGPVACKGDALQLQKVQVSWVRDVAPAPETPTFSDVPADHPFFQYVEALVASGVTGGCGNGQYCPDAPLTRGQMAVFLAKALGLEWPGSGDGVLEPGETTGGGKCGLPRSGIILGPAVLLILASGAAMPQGLTPMNRVPTSREAPAEFGVQNYTVETIPAVAFTAQSSDTSFVPPYYTNINDMSRFFLMDDGVAEIYAGVAVPAGAVIDYVGLDTTDIQGGLIGMALNHVDSAGTVTQIAAFSNTAHEFGMDFNATPIGYLVTSNAGQQLVLNVEFAAGASIPRFGFAEIRWRRTVSPAPPLPLFTDVSPNHPFYQFIEALGLSGITGGCGGGAYCPDAPVTRGQMAVFLAKALGLNW